MATVCLPCRSRLNSKLTTMSKQWTATSDWLARTPEEHKPPILPRSVFRVGPQQDERQLLHPLRPQVVFSLLPRCGAVVDQLLPFGTIVLWLVERCHHELILSSLFLHLLLFHSQTAADTLSSQPCVGRRVRRLLGYDTPVTRTPSRSVAVPLCLPQTSKRAKRYLGPW